MHHLGQYGFLGHEVDEGKKLFFHTSEVEDNQSLQEGDEVEFVVVTNKRTGKHSACCVRKLRYVSHIFFVKLNYPCISRVFFCLHCILYTTYTGKKLVKFNFTKFFASAFLKLQDIFEI